MLCVMCENKLACLLTYISVTQLPTAYWINGPLKGAISGDLQRGVSCLHKLVCHRQSLFGAFPALTPLSQLPLTVVLYSLHIYP